jgi:hypothetical protein
MILTARPCSWYITFIDKTDGRSLVMWLNGNQRTRQQVADHLAAHYRNMEVKTIDLSNGPPTKQLVHVPPHLFQYGILKRMEEYEDPDAPKSLLRKSILGPSLLKRR